MKTILLFLISISAIHAQTITETLDTYEKKYYNIFTQDGSTLRMNFLKKYENSQEDKVEYYFTISINNMDTESTSTTYGGMFIGSLLGSGITATYQTFEYGGAAVLDLEGLKAFFACANSVFAYINSRTSVPDAKPTTASCSSSGIILSGEYGSGVSYFFDAGDATFKMPPDDFISIMRTIQSSIREWERIIN